MIVTGIEIGIEVRRPGTGSGKAARIRGGPPRAKSGTAIVKRRKRGIGVVAAGAIGTENATRRASGTVNARLDRVPAVQKSGGLEVAIGKVSAAARGIVPAIVIRSRSEAAQVRASARVPMRQVQRS